MEGGFCMKWTSWRVWLHPFRARRHIEEANGMQEDLSGRLAEALDMLEKQRKECARITMDNVEMSRHLSDCQFELSRTRSELTTVKRKLEEAEERLAEHRSVDEKIAEFEKDLSRTEAMKQAYEKRIAELESRLGDAKSRLSRADDRELIDSIDMTAKVHPRYRRSSLTPARVAGSAPARPASARPDSAPVRSGAPTPKPQETKTESEELFDPSDPATVISIPRTSPATSKTEAASRNSSGKEELASKLPLRRNPKPTANSQDNDWLLTPPDF